MTKREVARIGKLFFSTEGADLQEILLANSVPGGGIKLNDVLIATDNFAEKLPLRCRSRPLRRSPSRST